MSLNVLLTGSLAEPKRAKNFGSIAKAFDPRHAGLLIVKHGEVDLAIQLTARELVREDEPKHIGCGETGGSAGTERILSRSGSDGTVLGY